MRVSPRAHTNPRIEAPRPDILIHARCVPPGEGAAEGIPFLPQQALACPVSLM